eukprot:CAMPEP_0203759968 /NCGR_PEP_ID=MMETSP0098-20131031/13318_1 /ASSEMBLY_ACC=CAM_ASM_000208 /TAXON_ID=96639 /ORGANISM=" , Strain NY0313808BC1" /LENGTH=533 /DNA_ID=CAMNT_0050653323 /DNA_START=158 /DNA_END=1759 /DNA_ORIENTATION=-
MLRSRVGSAVVKRQVRCFGALTSKPYAFTARPWELRNTETVDGMDGMGSNIVIQTKQGEIMRILPRTNDDINEEWIHDKTRFSYDGLKLQRLIGPLVRSTANNNAWDETASNWRGAFKHIADVLEKKKSSGKFSMRAVVGPTADLYSALALSDWVTKYADVDVETIGSRGGTAGADLSSQYRFNSGIDNLENSDFCLLVGTELQTEGTLLASRLRKRFLRDTLEVASVGPPSPLSFPYTQCGLTAGTLVEIAEGRHPIAKKIAQAKNPSIIVGASTFEREDGDVLAGAINTIAELSGSVRQYDKDGNMTWNGVNVLHHNANDVGLLELGRTVPFKKDGERPEVLYLMNVSADDLPVDFDQLIGDNTFVIVHNTHGDELASRADVVLPGATYSEKSGVYVNFEGRVQHGNNATTPPVDAREDWKIIRAISEVCGDDARLLYDSEKEIHDRLEQLVPTVGNLDKIVPTTAPEQLLGASEHKLTNNILARGVVNCTPLRQALYDFHLDGNSIARSSGTMAKCSSDLKRSNFIEMSF